MIVQEAANPDATGPQPRFVILMADHTAVAGDLARSFGNDRFAPLEPREIMESVITTHDAGWSELDGRVLRNPATGLPYHLVDTPLEEMVRTSAKSPDSNEAVHPYAGIISSMHSYGLYHGRYGLSDKLFIELLPDELVPYVTGMLDGELARQERLKNQLRGDEATAGWVTDDALFRNYKLLQLFDTFALYLQCSAPGSRGVAEFHNVPDGTGTDVTIVATEIDPHTVSVSPWPFSTDSVEVVTRGRWMSPVDDGDDLSAEFGATEPSEQEVTLVGG